MYRADAIDRIVTHPEEFLELDGQSSSHYYHGKESFICPVCGSGSGRNGTGITSKDGIHFTCWAGECFRNSDVIDIIGKKYELTGFNDKLKKACELYGIDFESLKSDDGYARIRKSSYSLQAEKSQNQPRNGQSEDETDFTEFFKKCAEHRKECDYLNKRGISDIVQDYFLIGYCAEWQSPKMLAEGKNPPKTPRIIIPTSPYSYIARDVRADADKKWAKMKGGSVHLFNLGAIESGSHEPVFVTEGEIDALSVITLGYRAIGLGGTSNYEKLTEYAKEHRTDQMFIFVLDNDEAGRGATIKALQSMREANIACCEYACYGKWDDTQKVGEYKDANERLVKDCEGLRQALSDAVEYARTVQDAEKIEYLRTSAYHYIDSFVTGAVTDYIPTGFETLDKEIDGGLYEGLYIVGAISSLGKTTFVLQIADQIAASGHDVLIFSLEMSRYSLMARSISRLTGELAVERDLDLRKAKTTRGITNHRWYSMYDAEEIGLIADAQQNYRKFADHIFISEGVGDIGVNEIREVVKKHIRYTGVYPVVIIDYLQIIAPYDMKATDKQNTDKAVLELKRMSRDYKIPVIGVSSFNRENYTKRVGMESFKESGAIEYSSDVLIGLQLSETRTHDKKDAEWLNNAKKNFPRNVDAVIIKNRDGRTGQTILFDMYSAYNYFEEKETQTELGHD